VEPDLDSPENPRLVADFLAGLADKLRRPVYTLPDFIRGAWPILEPGKVLIWNWHIDLICEHLQLVTSGVTRQLILNIPPRYMKSLLVSVFWPAWEWTQFPTLRYLFCSHEETLATDFSIARRDIMRSAWYRERWGSRIILKADRNMTREFENTVRGKMIATSTGGRGTGKGGDRVVIDDLINPRKAESDAERESGLRFYSRTLSTRLDDKKRGAIVIIEQRLHKRDLTALALSEGPGWTHIKIPAENATKKPLRFEFPISGRVHEMQPGDLCWPERDGPEELANVKIRLGSRGFSAQCLQEPTTEEGTLLKRHFWKFYTQLPGETDPKTGKRVLKSWDDMLQSWDCTFKKTESTDFVVGQVWGRMGADRYLLDQVRARMGIVETMAAIVSMTGKWPRASRKLIEEKANGAAVIELLKKKVPGLTPINPRDDKVARARAVEPIQESGNIYLPFPDIAPWVNGLIDECAELGEHDDQLDALTQANNFWSVGAAPMLTVL